MSVELQEMSDHISQNHHADNTDISTPQLIKPPSSEQQPPQQQPLQQPPLQQQPLQQQPLQQPPLQQQPLQQQPLQQQPQLQPHPHQELSKPPTKSSPSPPPTTTTLTSSALAEDRRKKLSVPFIEDRKRSLACQQGGFNRVVLCAVDASNHSRDAFEWYLKNIWKSDDMVIVAYCPETPNLPSFTFKNGLTPPVEKWKEIIDETNRRTRILEEEYEATCIEKKLIYMIRGESYKNPGEGICQIAEDEKAHMIVMGTRGMGTLKRFFLGSVSEYVVRHSRVPCIVVPA